MNSKETENALLYDHKLGFVKYVDKLDDCLKVVEWNVLSLQCITSLVSFVKKSDAEEKIGARFKWQRRKNRFKVQGTKKIKIEGENIEARRSFPSHLW